MNRQFVFYLISGALLGLLACSQQQRSDKTEAAARLSVTVGIIEQSIRDIGGRETLEKYMCYWGVPEGQRLVALDNVSAGSKEWVDLAVKMLEYSDASCTEDLLSYLGEAMQHQPRNVLPYVGEPYKGNPQLLSPGMICYPFVSNEIPHADALKIVQRSKAAVLSVKDTELTKQCAACLKEIESLEQIILADIAKEAK